MIKLAQVSWIKVKLIYKTFLGVFTVLDFKMEGEERPAQEFLGGSRLFGRNYSRDYIPPTSTTCLPQSELRTCGLYCRGGSRWCLKEEMTFQAVVVVRERNFFRSPSIPRSYLFLWLSLVFLQCPPVSATYHPDFFAYGFLLTTDTS